MGPEGKPVREPWHKKGQCLVAGTRLMSENLNLVAKMRTWNSNRVHCFREDNHNQKGTGQGMQATKDGKETEPDFRAYS